MVVGYIFFCACGWLVEMQELQDRVAKSKDSNEELMKVGREIVDFHGEMVLLENYSALNYTGIFLSLGIDLVLNLKIRILVAGVLWYSWHLRLSYKWSV